MDSRGKKMKSCMETTIQGLGQDPLHPAPIPKPKSQTLRASYPNPYLPFLTGAQGRVGVDPNNHPYNPYTIPIYTTIIVPIFTRPLSLSPKPYIHSVTPVPLRQNPQPRRQKKSVWDGAKLVAEQMRSILDFASWTYGTYVGDTYRDYPSY